MLSPTAPIGSQTGGAPIADQQVQPTQSPRETAPPPPAERSDSGNTSNNENNAGTNSAADKAAKTDTTYQQSNGPSSEMVRSAVENQLLSDDQAVMLSRAAQASVQQEATQNQVFELSESPGDAPDILASQAKDRRDAQTMALAKEAFAETREINRAAEEKAATTMRERL